MPNPICFILMPFGKKIDSTGRKIDFDAVYEKLIEPAIRHADMEPIRADEEKTGGIIHKPMFERLIICEYAVADLTTANANVFYELGVRHAVRPRSTVLLFADGCGQLPFDVAQLRAIPYRITADGVPEETTQAMVLLTERLKEARTANIDSPLFQLVENFPMIDHTKTDIFRDQADYSKSIKVKLSEARAAGKEAVRQVESEIGVIRDCEAGVVIDLFLSYRAVEGWIDMIKLVQKMSPELSATVMVQEQLGLALNRENRGEEAERVLLNLIAQRGPSSETCGILGRVYKDRWEAAVEAGETLKARGLLEKAVDVYIKGFEADWRDAYPGINAVTLMELKEPPDPRRLEILPVVRYAVKQRTTHSTPDYWDFATLLELAVLARDELEAMDALANALAAIREKWEPKTTARNLKLIHEIRTKRGNVEVWEKEIIVELEKVAGKE